MNYKVLLTTAGIGSRLGDLTKYTNKSLVRIGKKPAISYIIEAYPKEVSFVVTLGNFGDQVEDFLKLTHPDRKFEFIYDSFKASLGHSMLQARDMLDCPFIFHAGDTITEDIIPVPDHNWIAGFKSNDSTAYTSWKALGNESLVYNEKGAIDFDYLHIGIVGINDYERFWNELDILCEKYPNDSGINDGRTLARMLKNGSKFEIIEFFSWLDVGNTASLNRARNTVKDHFDNLDKVEESVFLFDDFVIKFFYDKEIVKKRVQRAEILEGLVPEIEGTMGNFYRYKFIKGDLYSRVVNPSDFKNFLKWAKENLWIKKDFFDNKKFKGVCKDFYYDKTLKRIEKFLSENNVKDGEETINGEKVPTSKDLISKIDFDWLSEAEQYRIHGDFILDNILKTKDSYFLIDWRHDFGGLLEIGDIYYDLAKLNHNLTVNHDIVNVNQYTIKTHEHIIDCDILRRENLVNCQKALYEFIVENGFDIKKVKILTGIIWLNMSPLHHHPFNLFLYYFGKFNLWKAINEK